MGASTPQRLRLTAALAGVWFGVGWALVHAQSAQSAEGDKVLEQEHATLEAVCAKCHNLEVVTSAAMSYEGWHDTVQAMIDRGAEATDDQLGDIMDYLHRTETTINVNSADSEELGMVLGVPDAVVNAIVARRRSKSFENIADLETVPGIERAALNAKSRLLFFK